MTAHFRLEPHDVGRDADATTHIKRFITGRYNNYVLRVIKHAHYDGYVCDWFRPGDKAGVTPPLDIQDALRLWERTPAWHGMSPVEFVHRMYCDVT